MTNRTIQTVRFLSQEDAGDCEPYPNTAMISIVGPAKPDASIKPGFHSLLRLIFDDADEEWLGMPVGSIPDYAPDGGVLIVSDYLMPDLHHAREIVKFIEDGDFEHLVIHCFAGQSRSAAVARFVSDWYDAELLLQNHVGTGDKNNRLYRLLHAAFLERHPGSSNHFV